MVRITEVRPLKNGRFGLFSDGNFLLSLDTDTLATSNVAAGDELSGEELDELARLAGLQKAKDKAFDLLSYRDHAGGELYRKLTRTVDDDSAREAVEKMKELGLVDDAAFAHKLARELMRGKAYGKNRVISELLHRGVDRELANEAAEAFDEDPAERALCFLKKKYPRGIADETGRRRATAALARNGYDWDTIRQALKNYGMDEQDAD